MHLLRTVYILYLAMNMALVVAERATGFDVPSSDQPKLLANFNSPSIGSESRLDIDELEDALKKLYGPGFTIQLPEDIPKALGSVNSGSAVGFGDPVNMGITSAAVGMSLTDESLAFQTSGDSMMAQSLKPKPLSILMNFGLDGVSRWSTPASELQNDCPAGHIFDPYAVICRPAVCVPLANPNTRADACVTHETRRTIHIAVNATEAKIFLSLGAHTEVDSYSLVKRNCNTDGEHEVENILQAVIADFLEINLEHVTNVTAPNFAGLCDTKNRLDNEHLKRHLHYRSSEGEQTDFRVEASLVLHREPECQHICNTDSVVELYDKLARAVLAEESFTFTADDMQIEIFAIWEEKSAGLIDLAESQSWCKLGTVQIYCNEDFSLNLNGSKTTVTVNATGVTYYCGDFKLQIFLKEVNGKAFSSSVALVCDTSPSCPDNAAMFIASGAVLLPNMSIQYNNKLYDRSEYEEYQETGSSVTQFMLCGVNKIVAVPVSNIVMGFNMRDDLSIISTTLSSLSIVALVLTLIIYAIFRDLRTLPGWNLINVMVTLIVAQLALLLNSVFTNKQWCAAVGIITHLAYLMGFFFANVIAIDIYLTFGRGRIGTFRIPNSDRKAVRIRLLKRMVYCCLSAGCIVAAAVILDYYDVPDWKVEYEELCWIAGERASSVFFALPIVLINAANATLVGVTFYRVRKHEKAMKAICTGAVKGGAGDGSRREAMSYVRIGTVFGFTWMFGIVAGFVRGRAGQDETSLVVYEVMIYIFLFTQASQGLLIFLAFGVNARVRAKVAHLYRRLSVKGCRICSARVCRCLNGSTISKAIADGSYS